MLILYLCDQIPHGHQAVRKFDIQLKVGCIIRWCFHDL